MHSRSGFQKDGHLPLSILCHLPAGQPFFKNLVSTIIRKGMVDEFNAQVSVFTHPPTFNALLKETPGPWLTQHLHQIAAHCETIADQAELDPTGNVLYCLPRLQMCVQP